MINKTEPDCGYTDITVFGALTIVDDDTCQLSVQAHDTMPIPIVFGRAKTLLKIVDYRLMDVHCELNYYENVGWFIYVRYEDAHKEVWQ